MVSSQEQEHHLKAALTDRYAIEEKIDSGGMATVYRARDLKHDRTVAIKVLRPDLAEAIGADRFLREIRTTANLSHPHILPLFDSGDADGFLYYVMPFVEGESLADRMEREGQLPVEDAVQIAREVAEALAYAHEKGVIHRDVKPANIMLERGHALLADFGIAQARAGAEETKLTGSGMSLGTPNYMSPEQIAGDREVDGRADQYALGCVLYEMLAGHAPFEGADIQTVMRQHLAADAPRVTGARPSAPRGVATAVHRALAKSPADRFRNMGELETALAGATLPLLARIPMGRARAVVFAATFVLALAAAAVIASVWGPGGPELQDDLAVVLPFSNWPADSSFEDTANYAAFLLADCLRRTDVVRGPIPDQVFEWWDATSERRHQHPEFESRRELAEYFGAGIVVQGSVLFRTDSLRLTAEFMEAGDLVPVQELDPVAVTRDRLEEGAGILCQRLSAALAVHLDRGWNPEGASDQFNLPPSLPVWSAWRAAGEAYYRRDLGESLRQFEIASESDPTYAPSKVGQALVHFNLGNLPRADSILTEAEESSFEWAPGNSAWVGWLRAMLEGDLEGAYRTMKEENYGDPTWIWLWSRGAQSMNRPREALEVLSRLDPDSPVMQRNAGYWSGMAEALHTFEKHRKELGEVRKGRERHPDDPSLLQAEIRAHAALGHIREVNALLDEALNKDAQPTPAFMVAALELRAHRKREASLSVADRALAHLQGRPAEEVTTFSHQREFFRALYVEERWDEAQQLVDELVRENSTHLPTLRNLLGDQGAVAARRGEDEVARDIEEHLAAMEIPYDRGKATYGRARIEALLGEKDQAVLLLRQAHKEGWYYSVDLHTEMDFEGLRGFAPFEEFKKPRG